MSPQPIWLFDLDNTLHNASPHIFPHINYLMREYIKHHLDVTEQEADHIRQVYWKRYGATLLGLMRHHGTDPHHFLRETHLFPNLKPLLVFEKAITHALRRLPGRKILFSNAPGRYAAAVLDLTGMTCLFDAIYSVERIRFQPKPMAAGFRNLLKAEGLNPRGCIMVEDSLPNLVTAKSLGMRTVWVSSGSRLPPYVDIRVRSVLELPRRLSQL